MDNNIEDKQDFLRSIDGFRKLAQSLASTCMSLGALALALLGYLRHANKELVIEAWFTQSIGIAFIVAAAFAIDWLADSLREFEWAAARLTSEELQRSEKSWWNKNQFLDRVVLFTGAYVLYALSVSALIFALAYVAAGGKLWVILSGLLLAVLFFFKLTTQKLPWWHWIVLVIFVLAHSAFSYLVIVKGQFPWALK